MRFLTRVQERWQELESGSRLVVGYLFITLMAVIAGCSTLTARTTALQHKRVQRQKVLQELLCLKSTYDSARQSADVLAGRMAALRPEDSLGKLVEEIGIKGKGTRVAPVKGDVHSGLVEDAAEVKIDGLSANETVNLIYRLEKGARPVLVKKANMRVRYDDPARLDLSLTLALLKPLPGGRK